MQIHKRTRIPISALVSASLAVTISIGTGAAAAAAPRLAAASHTAYAAIDAPLGSHSRPWVLPVNTITGRPGRRIPLSTEFVDDIVAAPNGRFVYAEGSTQARPGRLFVISTAANAVVAAIKIPSAGCQGLGITPDGRTVYETCLRKVYAVDTTTDKITATITIRGSSPQAIAITPDSRTAYAICYTAFRFSCPASGDIAPVDLTTGTVEKPVSGGDDPQQIAITADGKTVYVANVITPSGRGNVIPIRTATNTSGKPIGLGRPGVPRFVFAAPDGKTVYAAGYTGRGWLTPISTATNTAGKRIDLGGDIQCMAFTGQGSVPRPFCGFAD